MRKNLPIVVVLLIVTGLVIYYSMNLYQFVAKTYYVDESKLYRVDTFHLSGRAFRESEPGGRSSRSYPKLVIQSTSGYTFAIDKDIFEAITDRQRLEDTLMYHDLKFTVFTDKEYFDKYHKYNRPIFIRAYQIEIGNKKYIDIEKMNKITKGKKKRAVLAPPALVLFLGLLLYKGDRWSKRKVMIWFFAFILTIVGLLLLT